MRILVVGGGPRSGASCVRAEQLGRAIGARVHVDPYHDPPRLDYDWADTVIVVKRLKKRFRRWLEGLRHSRKRIVWDCLDFWKQPDLNYLDRTGAMELFHATRATIAPRLLIAATQAMAADIRGVYLPHHARPGLVPTPVRPTVQMVAYEGSDRYLGDWQPAIAAACAARGWDFVLNPPLLSDADIIVAFRGGEWDGWACRAWKSGIKYANALAAGRPVITQPCAAFTEIGPPGTAIDDPAALGPALDAWASADRREEAAAAALGLAPAYDLRTVAARYRQVLLKALS